MLLLARLVSIAVASLVLLSCKAGDKSAVAEVAEDTAASVTGKAAPVAPPDPYRNYSRLTDSDCGLDSTPAHPEPVALVREFVDRDGRAEFARGSDWLVNAVLCPGHLPGPDAFVAIDTAVLLTAGIQVAADSAWVPVRYEVLGEASPLGFGPAPATLVDTFLVTRTSAGWRVVAPNMPMRIRATVATEWRELLSDSLRAVIRSAAEASRARRAAGT